jgi:hypothetical protein
MSEEISSMDDDTRSDSMHRVIVTNMRAKESEELLAIWQKNDRKEWTEEAFGIVHDILLERLGSVPEQGAPYVEPTEETDGDDEGDQVDAYHNPDLVLRIAFLATRASRIVVALGVIMIILQIAANVERVPARSSPLYAAYSIIFPSAANAISWIVAYITLRAISQILYLLLDIHNNTARASTGSG